MKKPIMLKFALGILLVALGLWLNYAGVQREFFNFSSVGSWMIYAGFLIFFIICLRLLSRKERKTDERIEFIGNKASRVTFLFLIIAAFVVMIADGIRPINLPYHYFMSYLVSALLIVYFISFRIIEKKN